MNTGAAPLGEHNSFVSGLPGTDGGAPGMTPLTTGNAQTDGGVASQENDPVKAQTEQIILKIISVLEADQREA